MLDRFPLHALRSLLSRDSPTRGVVIKIDGAAVFVATQQGLQRFIANVNVPLSVGQSVSIQNNMAFPVVKPTAVYQL